jgi:hypothetical protein
MGDTKAGVAVFVKSRVKKTDKDEWQDGWLFGGRFDNIADSLGYLQYLEKRETEFTVQIGYVGWRTD